MNSHLNYLNLLAGHPAVLADSCQPVPKEICRHDMDVDSHDDVDNAISYIGVGIPQVCLLACCSCILADTNMHTLTRVSRQEAI